MNWAVADQVVPSVSLALAVRVGQAAFGTLIGPGFLDHVPDATADDLPTNIGAMRALVRAFPASPSQPRRSRPC